jgi:hypothetical protein
MCILLENDINTRIKSHIIITQHIVNQWIILGYNGSQQDTIYDCIMRQSTAGLTGIMTKSEARSPKE